MLNGPFEFKRHVETAPVERYIQMILSGCKSYELVIEQFFVLKLMDLEGPATLPIGLLPMVVLGGLLSHLPRSRKNHATSLEQGAVDDILQMSEVEIHGVSPVYRKFLNSF